MSRVVIVSALCLLVAGCGGGLRSGAFDAEPEPPIGAYARLRAAVPALEAWYADHGTYRGATAVALRSRYDAGLEGVRIVSSDARGYCMEASQGQTTWSMRGPAGHIVLGRC
jgi:hypothetical protein